MRKNDYVDNDLLYMPDYPLSKDIPGMTRLTAPMVIGTGDMWPLTWADDNDLYTGAGDNYAFGPAWSFMNFWKITGTPPGHDAICVNSLDFVKGLVKEEVKYSVKPAGVICVDGVLYLAVEDMLYHDGRYGNQINIGAWIITSADHGRTWSPVPDEEGRKFFTGRFASPHFLQFGRDYSGARDSYVYAYSCAGDDGGACWSAGDEMFLGRVPKDSILERAAWEFFGGEAGGHPKWVSELEQSVPVFRYPKKTGENEVVYNAGLGRYLLLNWAFIDCTNHRVGSRHSELTIFEAPDIWGPWALVYRELNWGYNCDYQPRLPTKWISPDGRTAWILSAGNFHRDGGRMHYGMVTSQVEFGTGNYGDIHPKNVPGIVRDVQATPLSDSEIKLSWIADVRAGFYCITRDGIRLADIGSEVRPQQFLDDKLENNRTYTYTI
ncbi:MAG: DUF4185 domain-containing protein, partial [Ruminiclostridium sp.]|nr:DUF4185 domain-containing protein [Ruminiclostridium sp.]